MNDEPARLQRRLYRWLLLLLLVLLIADLVCGHWHQFLSQFPVQNF